MESTNKTTIRLKKKLNKKKGLPPPPPDDDNNIFNMLNQVNAILKKNPELVSKVNKCVSNIIENKDLMTKLTTEIQNNIQCDPELDSDPERGSDSDSEQEASCSGSNNN